MSQKYYVTLPTSITIEVMADNEARALDKAVDLLDLIDSVEHGSERIVRVLVSGLGSVVPLSKGSS